MLMLPKNKSNLTKAVDRFVEEAESRFLPKFLQMALSYLYVQGHRDMSVTDLHTGQILFNRVDWTSGRRRYIDNRVQTKYNRAAEHLAKLDFSPIVESVEVGLNSFRERAAAQVLIDAVSHETVVSKFRDLTSTMAPMYGGVGVLADVFQRPSVGFVADYDVVAPWNVFPMPLTGMNLDSDMCGHMLRRFKSMAWMKQKFGDKVGRNKAKMDVWRSSPGVHSILSAIDNDSSLNVRSLGNPGGKRARGADETTEEICELREIWLYDTSGFVSRYIAVCGDWVIEDREYPDETVCPPLSYARYRNDGTFHGIGVPGVLMPLATEAESLLSKLIEYATDIDRFGFIFFPDSMVDLQQLKKGPHGLMVGRYDPDLTGSAKPYHVPPPAPTDVPGRVAATISGLMSEMVPDPEILHGDAPGRVESPSALAMLNEAANAAVATGSDNLAHTKGSADRYIVQRVGQIIAESPSDATPSFPIRNLDINLIGAIVDGGRENGESLSIGFSRNPVPDVTKLRFTIKEKRPRLLEARRQEVALAYTQGRLDPIDFKIINYKENLGLPMAQGVVAHSYRSATIHALLLFNDGEKAGQAIVQHDLAGDHEVILHVIDELMSMPEFLLASSEIHEAFSAWKRDEMGLLGMRLPGSTPPVDEAAAILQQGEGIMNQLRQRANQV